MIKLCKILILNIYIYIPFLFRKKTFSKYLHWPSYYTVIIRLLRDYSTINMDYCFLFILITVLWNQSYISEHFPELLSLCETNQHSSISATECSWLSLFLLRILLPTCMASVSLGNSPCSKWMLLRISNFKRSHLLVHQTEVLEIEIKLPIHFLSGYP